MLQQVEEAGGGRLGDDSQGGGWRERGLDMNTQGIQFGKNTTELQI